MFVEVQAPEATSTQTSAGGDRKASWSWARLSPKLVPYLYLLPAVVLLVVWIYKPLVENFGLSVYDWNMIPTSPKTPVGADNYSQVMSLPELHQALRNTIVYILAFLLFSMVVPVVVGLVCRRVTGRWRTFYQALIFVPFLVTPVASSAIWRWLFNPDGGVIPQASSALGYDMGNVFRDPTLAIIGVIVTVGWQLLGFGVLVVSAGLAGINTDYSAAAALDGAKQSTITRRIILPLLSPTLVFLGLMTILLGAQWAYPVLDILTQGGPNGATNNIYYLLYQFAFQNFDAGLSAAAGTLFFVGFALVAVVFVWLSNRLSFYDN
jgi:multiple sugar transport system permease protein